jgi:hypothetical protein
MIFLNDLNGEVRMKTYRGVVVFRYYKEVTVEAENEDEARSLMYDAFERGNADGESEIQDFEEVQNED